MFHILKNASKLKLICFFHLNGTLRRLLQVKIPSQFPLVLWNTSAEVVKQRYSIYFVFNTLFSRFSKARYPTILGLCISEHACLGLWPTTEWNIFSKRFIYFIILFVPIIIKCSFTCGGSNRGGSKWSNRRIWSFYSFFYLVKV